MTRRKIITFIIILVVESALWFFYATQSDPLKSALLGILTSLNASIIFYILSEFVFSDADTKRKEINDKFDEMNGELKDLSNILTNANEIINNGLVSIRHKDFYDAKHDFWYDVLAKAQDGLDLAGYTLSSWFRHEYKQKFIDTIHRLIDKDKVVRIIMLDPRGKSLEAIESQIEGKVKEKAKRVEQEFQEIAKKIPQEKQHLLDIRYASNSNIQYMYIRNDNNSVISPYMLVSSSRKSFLTVFKNDSQYAGIFLNDFDLLFDKLERWHGNTCIQDVEIKKAENGYKGHLWTFEETTKYIFTIDGNRIEAGYFIHYKDKTKNEIVKHVIELPTSYGCPMKCGFCASSGIKDNASISSKNLFDIFLFIYNKHSLSDAHSVVLTLTGTGDFFFTNATVMAFLAQIKSYNNIEITISSIFWTEDTLKSVSEISRIRNIQITYISFDKLKVTPVIPRIKNMEYSFENTIALIKNSALNCFRINYLMITDINDGIDDFEAFISFITSIKEKIVIRISKLNETNASLANQIIPAKDEKLNKLLEMLEQEGFNAYIFCSDTNDHMNCGQLLTEAQFTAI